MHWLWRVLRSAKSLFSTLMYNFIWHLLSLRIGLFKAYQEVQPPHYARMCLSDDNQSSTPVYKQEANSALWLAWWSDFNLATHEQIYPWTNPLTRDLRTAI